MVATAALHLHTPSVGSVSATAPPSSPWTLIHDFMWTTELSLLSLTTTEALTLPQVLMSTCSSSIQAVTTHPCSISWVWPLHLGKQLIFLHVEPPGVSFLIQNIHMETLCHSRKSHMTRDASIWGTESSPISQKLIPTLNVSFIYVSTLIKFTNISACFKLIFRH